MSFQKHCYLMIFLVVNILCQYKYQTDREDISDTLQKELNSLHLLLKHKCLNTHNKTDTYIRSLNEEQKLDLFTKSNCPPVVLIPGLIGSKLELTMKKCTEFMKNHKNIMDSCGWKNCFASELKRFTVWVNVDIDLAAIFGMDENVKKEHIPKILRYGVVGDFKADFPQKKACFGNLMKLYYEKNHNNLVETVKLKGAEVSVRIDSRKDCGGSSVSNYAGILSSSRIFQGYNNLLNLLNRMGYQNGISLFPFPYDFRLSLKEITTSIKRTINIAYKLNKKKVLLIGHSLGGLVAYNYALENPQLIERIISIGTPFLGSRVSLSSFLSDFSIINQKKMVNIAGMQALVKTKIDKPSNQIMQSTFKSIIELLPRRVVKSYHNDDLIDKIILELSNIERKVEDFLKNNKNNRNVEELFNNLINSSSNKELIKYFYTFFQKPFEDCNIPVKTVKHWTDSCKLNSMDHFLNHSILVDKESFNITFIKEIKRLYEEKSYLDYKLLNHNNISRNEFIDYLFDRKESDVYKFINPGVPFTFIFSSHLPTIGKYEIIKKQIQKKVHYPGDGTVDTFSQIYPGLRWTFENKMNKSNKTIHFVEYCTSSNKKYLLINFREGLNLHISQHLKIGCDCLGKGKIDINEYCSHPSMINDNQLLKFVSEVILASDVKTQEVKGFESLYHHKISRNDFCSNFY